MLDQELISILRCPVTKRPLRPGTEAEFESIAAETRNGWDGILVVEDGSAFYPIENGIPALVADQRRTFLPE